MSPFLVSELWARQTICGREDEAYVDYIHLDLD